MNNIENHQEELLNSFINYFNFLVNKNINSNFSEIVIKVEKEFEISLKDTPVIKVFEKYYQTVYEQKFLTELIDSFEFDEIILHNHQHVQIISHDQKNEHHLTDLTPHDFQRSLELLTLKNNVTWNNTSPFASFNWAYQNHNYRVTVAHFSISSNSTSKIFIRRHRDNLLDLSYFTQDFDCLQSILNIVKSKKNILIAGPTGSGKTSLLRALLNTTLNDEHLIILEDTHEIKLNRENTTYLIADPKINGRSLVDYCAYSMRLSPDRIILGEMRGEEVIPFLLAMNTGHKGLVSTIHANSAVDAISRLNLLFCIYGNNKNLNSEYVSELICRNIDAVIFIENKKIKEIVNILGQENSNPYTDLIYSNAS